MAGVAVPAIPARDVSLRDLSLRDLSLRELSLRAWASRAGLSGAAAALLTATLASGCPAHDLWLGDPQAALDGTSGGSDTTSPDANAPPDASPPTSCLQASSLTIDFGLVQQAAERPLVLQNNCDETVTIRGFVLSGSPGFAVSVGALSWAVSPATATAGVSLSSPVSLGPGEVLAARVSFVVSSAEPAAGTVIWRSDDPAQGLGLAVKLRANSALPCLVTFPKEVGFGGTLVGDVAGRQLLIKSCGDTFLQVTEVRVEGPPGTGEFSVVGSSSGPWPWVLAPGEVVALSLEYVAGEVAAIAPDGQPVSDLAVLVLESNTLQGVSEVDLHGFGAAQPCPHAVIAPGPAASVAPGAVLSLDGSASYGGGSPVESWQWTATGPQGAPLQVLPSPNDQVVSVSLLATGSHTVELLVVDAEGRPACAPAVHHVEVVPEPTLYVDLTWVTPTDPDPFDVGLDAGTDLDLHFLHPFATGEDVDQDGVLDGWFDKPFDVSWPNPAPNWGDIDDPKAADDPVLDRDDRDGSGPEVVLLEAPDPEASYRIGVHYWESSGYGTATATVRVWLGGELLAEVTSGELVEGQLWTVGEVRPGAGLFIPAAADAVTMVTLGSLKSKL